MYFIDKLALRAGNEKDTDESADTVGCCSIRVEHISKRGRGVVYADERGVVWADERGLVYADESGAVNKQA